MDKIVGIGNALTDILVNIEDDSFLKRLNVNKGGVRFIDKEEFAATNETIARMNPYYSTGGSAGNTVFALARLGLDVAMFGKLGDDVNGDFYRARFRELGGKYITFGSDAHYAEHLAAGFAEAHEAAVQAGFDECVFFQNHHPMCIPLH